LSQDSSAGAAGDERGCAQIVCDVRVDQRRWRSRLERHDLHPSVTMGRRVLSHVGNRMGLSGSHPMGLKEAMCWQAPSSQPRSTYVVILRRQSSTVWLPLGRREAQVAYVVMPLWIRSAWCVRRQFRTRPARPAKPAGWCDDIVPGAWTLHLAVRQDLSTCQSPNRFRSGVAARGEAGICGGFHWL
jgi:hypothetical protein